MSQNEKPRAKTSMGNRPRVAVPPMSPKERPKTTGTFRRTLHGKDGHSVVYDSNKPPLTINIKARPATGGSKTKEKATKEKKKKKNKQAKAERLALEAQERAVAAATNLNTSNGQFFCDDKGHIQRVCQRFAGEPEKRPTTVCMTAPPETIQHVDVINMARLRLCPISPKNYPGTFIIEYVAKNVIGNCRGLPDTWYITVESKFEVKELLKGLSWEGHNYFVRTYDDVMAEEFKKFTKVMSMSNFVGQLGQLGSLRSSQPPSRNRQPASAQPGRIELPVLWEKDGAAAAAEE